MIRGSRPKPAGPLEHDIQTVVLNCLGRQEHDRVKDENGKWIWRPLGIYINPHGLFWRANTGAKKSEYKGKRYFTRYNVIGTADILGLYYRVPMALEVKRPGKKLSAEQERWKGWWEAAGGIYRRVESPSDAQRALQYVREWLAEPMAEIFRVPPPNGP